MCGRTRREMHITIVKQKKKKKEKIEENKTDKREPEK